VDIERELARQSLFSYENTVLNALLEVDNSLIALSTLKDELMANQSKYRAASNASSLSRQRYYQGVTSYLEVIENQRQEFEAQLEEVAAGRPNVIVTWTAGATASAMRTDGHVRVAVPAVRREQARCVPKG